MQQFQTEVYILQTAFVVVWQFSLCCHWCSVGRRIDNANRDVKVLALEVCKLLFGHVEVWGIGIIVLVYLYLCLFFDDFTECQHEVALIQFALQRVDILWLGIFLQELNREVVQFFLYILKWRTNDELIRLIVAE